MPLTDDLDVVRQVLVEAPPSAQVKASGRDRLTSFIEAETSPGKRAGGWWSAWPGWRGRRGRRARLGMSAAAVLAGATAVVIGLASVLSGGPGPTGTRGPAGGEYPPESGQQILLAAANSAAHASPQPGRYWHLRQIEGAYSITNFSRDPVDGNWIAFKTLSNDWYARSSAGRSWHTDQPLGPGPRSGPGDSWTIGQTINDLHLTVAQILRLPTDPGRLRSALVRLDSPLRRPLPVDDGYLFGTVSELLRAPAPPQVRAAAYRMLAQMPEVRSVGLVRDPLGRTGEGIYFYDPSSLPLTGTAEPTSVTETLMLIKPSTGTLLAYEFIVLPRGAGLAGIRKAIATGSLFMYSAVETAGWANTIVPKPTNSVVTPLGQ